MSHHKNLQLKLEMAFMPTDKILDPKTVFSKSLKVVATAEIKYSNSPQLSKGNFLAFEDLNAPVNYVITPSSEDYISNERVRVCSLKAFISNYLPHL